MSRSHRFLGRLVRISRARKVLLVAVFPALLFFAVGLPGPLLEERPQPVQDAPVNGLEGRYYTYDAFERGALGLTDVTGPPAAEDRMAEM